MDAVKIQGKKHEIRGTRTQRFLLELAGFAEQGRGERLPEDLLRRTSKFADTLEFGVRAYPKEGKSDKMFLIMDENGRMGTVTHKVESLPLNFDGWHAGHNVKLLNFYMKGFSGMVYLGSFLTLSYDGRNESPYAGAGSDSKYFQRVVAEELLMRESKKVEFKDVQGILRKIRLDAKPTEEEMGKLHEWIKQNPPDRKLVEEVVKGMRKERRSE